ncbi:MAG TPA: IS66 family transposase [Cryptosporangiaceae bacterium]|nr:IS66 family transposase [Cryptosporangiaceae bacterium]
MDSRLLREEVLAAYAGGPEGLVGLVGRLVAGFEAQLERVVSQVAVLEAENAALRSEHQALRGRLGKDSHNSSKPPSTDGPGTPKRVPKSLRGVSGRRPGGQPGHPGASLTLVEQPDEVVVHQPSVCAGCGHDLGAAVVLRTERRQVIDLPVVRAQVVEHRAETRSGPECGQATTAPFPTGVPAPIQYGPGVATVAVYLHQEQLLPVERTGRVLGEVFGCPISNGTLEQMVARCADAVAAIVAAIKQAVIAAAILHVDETGLSLNGKTAWLHVASTDRLTWYATHRKRGREALDARGVLPTVRGRVVHDGLWSYWHYEQCAHALCNAHHLRELTFVEEHLQQTWAGQLKTLLLEIKAAADRARVDGVPALPSAAHQDWTARYTALVTEGLRLNPAAPPTGGKQGRPKRSPAGNLALRLATHQAETLAFMTDLRVPFDNNQAERDLRMMKVRQKVSGCFRSMTAVDRFCQIRSYVATLRKQGFPILASLADAFRGQPPVPALT